jgi:hypothetical protein
MAHSLLNPEEYRSACGLRDRQIPLDEDGLERMRVARLGLSIHEVGPSFAFTLPSGGAGYDLSVGIRIDSEQRLSAEHIGFGGLSWECRFQLLPDPQKENPMRFYNSRQYRHRRKGELDYLTARQLYVFPGFQYHEHERDTILNHRIGPRRFLFPDEFPEGFLLAVGQEPIPLDYAEGDCLKLRVTVFDQRGRFHAAWFHPIVERSGEEKRLMQQIASLDRTRIREKRAASAA